MTKHRSKTRFFLVLLMVLSAVTTLLAAAVFWKILQRDGMNLLDFPLLGLFGILFMWVAIGFWTATFGLVRELAVVPGAPVRNGEDALETSARTAIVMPVYNEDPARVFAGIAAMHDELQETGQGGRFDFFILSDSTDPDNWLEEEAAWASLRTQLRGASGLFYRRRSANTGRKAGNIQDFCQRWGTRYRYMIVLDADSLMAGTTFVEMVQRMEQDPQIGLLQTPPMPVNRESFFARLQQFSAHLYGEIFTSGYALWTQIQGNYWGHNAIIRVRAFIDSCGLPTLPGKPPLGGEILSHDFVEAALLRRAGWRVVVDHDLRGSYEECPTNLIDFAKRDQRWCQGNLQHQRLTFGNGLRPVSRLHLAMGAMSFLSSPLWALFLLLAIVQGIGFEGSDAPSAADAWRGLSAKQLATALFLGTMALLLLPKFWSLLLALTRPHGLDRFGGNGRASLGVLLEIAVSLVMAPIMMAFHTTFVIAAFLGHSVQWETQRRDATRISFHDALRAHALHTIAGLASLLMVQWLAPEMLLWTSPVLVGLVFSVPISMLLGSDRAGRLLRGQGLLLIPEEIDPPSIIRGQQAWMAARAMEDAPHPLARVVIDPAFNALHVAMLGSGPDASGSLSEPELERLRRVALSGGPDQLTKPQRSLIASHAPTLRWLHREAWKEWPIDLLERIATLAQRDQARPALPPSDDHPAPARA